MSPLHFVIRLNVKWLMCVRGVVSCLPSPQKNPGFITELGVLHESAVHIGECLKALGKSLGVQNPDTAGRWCCFMECGCQSLVAETCAQGTYHCAL